MIGLAMMLAAAQNGAILPVQQKLDQLDRTFVCPESLPSDGARMDALKLFIAQLQAAEPNLTIRNLVEYRQSLLVKHSCTITLQNERQNLSKP
jgi:hypothetical protein